MVPPPPWKKCSSGWGKNDTQTISNLSPGCCTSYDVTKYYNNRLFMVPHLVKAQSAYIEIKICSFCHTYTHTNTHTLSLSPQIHALLVMGWLNEIKENNRSVYRREEVGFQFWLKRSEWRRMPDRERKRVPDHRSNVLKWYLPQGPPAHPRNVEDPSIPGWAKRVRSRVEMKQPRQVWMSCTRDNMEAAESYFVLTLAADW